MRYFLPVFLVVALSACQPRHASRTAPGPTPEPERTPRVILNAGAQVRAQLADREVIGQVLAPYTPDSQQIVICEARQARCAGPDDPRAVRLPMDAVRRLSVWGKQTGFGTYFGFFSGALAGSLRDPNGAEIILGGFLGGALGWVIGSRANGWVLVFPCYHACAAGEYPER